MGSGIHVAGFQVEKIQPASERLERGYWVGLMAVWNLTY